MWRSGHSSSRDSASGTRIFFTWGVLGVGCVGWNGWMGVHGHQVSCKSFMDIRPKPPPTHLDQMPRHHEPQPLPQRLAGPAFPTTAILRMMVPKPVLLMVVRGGHARGSERGHIRVLLGQGHVPRAEREGDGLLLCGVVGIE